MAVGTEAQALAKSLSAKDAVDAIPRAYNFADDLFGRFRDKGWLDRTAFIDPHGSWSYAQLVERAQKFSLVLQEKGIQPGERVLMALLDTIDWPGVFLGTLHAGRVAVPVNTLMTEDDYRFMLADSGARMLVVSQALLPKFEKLVTALPDFHLIVADSHDELPHQDLDLLIESMSGPARPAPTTCDDIAFWLYTSGSTGKPKAAVHVHADMRLTNDLYAAPILGITANDVCFSVAKLFFAYGLGNAMTFPLSAGATTVLLPDRPSPDAVAEILKRHEVTAFYAVPTSTPRSWRARRRRRAMS